MSDVATPKVVSYEPSVTGFEFHNSEADVRLVMGPVGSGKSTMMIIELIMMALMQKPDKNGERCSRWIIVRETYPQLRNTVYESFKLWLKHNGVTVRYTETAPMRCRWTDKLEDGTKMNAEFIFMAVSKPEDYENLKSFELTGAFINECGAMDFDLVSLVHSRLGRYPAPVDAVDPADPITRVSLIMDTNPPEDDSWVAEKFKNTPKNWEMWQQPAAIIPDASSENGFKLNPDGENFDFIGVGPTKYYLEKVESMTPEQIKVLFQGEFGVTQDGKAIYRHQWSDSYHMSKARFSPVAGQPILLGWDWGKGGEACIIGQQLPNGQLRILAELYGDNISLHPFAVDHVRPFLEEHYPKGKYDIISVGDPAGKASHGLSKDGLNYFDVLNNSRYGVFKDWFITKPAQENHIELRLNAVRDFLTGKTASGAPMFQLDPECTMLRRGFNAKYCYERKQVAGKAQYKDKPSKNDVSHPHDALQYLCMEIHPNFEQLKMKTAFVTREPVDPRTNYRL